MSTPITQATVELLEDRRLLSVGTAVPARATVTSALAVVAHKSVLPVGAGEADRQADAEEATGEADDEPDLTSAPQSGDGEKRDRPSPSRSPGVSSGDGESGAEDETRGNSSVPSSSGLGVSTSPPFSTNHARADTDRDRDRFEETGMPAPSSDGGQSASAAVLGRSGSLASSGTPLVVEAARIAFNASIPIVASSVGQVRSDLPLAAVRAGLAAAATATLAARNQPSALRVAARVADLANLADWTLIRLGQPDATAAFADAITRFIHESAALGLGAGTTRATHARAWAVSVAVIAADTVLIGQWYRARRRERRRSAPTFALAPFSI